jgi:branched-chain amino acid transport system substrate-binding protein
MTGAVAGDEHGGPRMDTRFEKLLDQLQRGRIDRRTFMVRAVALGATGSAVFSALSRVGLAEAQGEKATDIGNPDIPHITTTDKGTIKLYSSWPYTGVMKAIGADAVEATKLALSDYGNAAGGFALEYVPLDDGIAANNGGWDPGAEAANVNQALGDPDAMVYMATYNSGAAKISIPITNEAGMAQISFANTYPGLSKAIEGATEEGEPDVYYPSGKRTYMRTVPADDVQGVAGANWAFESKGARKAYVLDDQSLYGHGVAQVFNNAFRELGGEVLGAEGWDKNAPDYQALMTKIADMGPDIVYLGATVENNTPKVVLDLRSIMAPDQVTCLCPDGLITTAFIDGAGDAAEGTFVTFAGFPPAELKGPGADYAKRITEILGHSPDSYSVYAYEVTAVVIQAIDKVQEKDRGKILDAMFATKDFKSLLGGTWSFTETGDTDALTMSLNEVKRNDEGKLDFAFVEPIGG